MTIENFMKKCPDCFPTGFISPNGNFHYVNSIYKIKTINLLCHLYQYNNYQQNAEKILMENGWIYITKGAFINYLMIISEKHWTEAQIKAIRPLIENPPIPLEQGAHWLYGRYYPDIDIKSKEMELIF